MHQFAIVQVTYPEDQNQVSVGRGGILSYSGNIEEQVSTSAGDLNTDCPQLLQFPPPSPGLEERSEEPPQEMPMTLVLRTWSMVVVTFVTCMETHPGLKQELLEEIEDWLQEWNRISTAMAASSDKARAAGIALNLDEGEVKLLTETTKWAGVAQKTVSDWKKHAEELMAAATDARTGKAPAVTAAEDCDMGVLCPGGCMSTPKCNCCTVRGIMCNGTLAKRKAVPGAPCSHKVVCSGEATVPAPTVTTADDADTSGKSEVKIQEEWRYHSHGQEAELLLMSNKLYTMSDDWSIMEREMGDILREQ
ncbi:uncharacterized protein BJ212DRAFT_1296673 [Suillus subaureus]|uniref:Uncharacterized protein n=1 Tax=Suillus subaureus TaxID=48587 RepID=A0A9P7EIY1_9AGAM|nr:uncharacterized protein BJ212DRAFT_1296673 [Suillus subaureus]KAG1822678.1 hypothetical protein BJ212DRAFT_1296673 [Suillus subaureus]